MTGASSGKSCHAHAMCRCAPYTPGCLARVLSNNICHAFAGIGKATAELLSRKGAVVVVADIDSQRGEQTAAHIGGTFTHSNVS